MTVHVDTDFLVHALSGPGSDRRWLPEIAESGHLIEMSAVAWYEFSRGPRTPEQLATARAFFAVGGIIPLSEQIAGAAAEVFRQLGSPRRRAADIVIGVTAAFRNATLLTRNASDFTGIPNLHVEDRETAGR